VHLDAAIYSTAITYQPNGKQYVVNPSGSTLFARWRISSLSPVRDR